MSDPVSTDSAYTAVRKDAIFIIEYQVTGPNVPKPFTTISVVPRRVLVEVWTIGSAIKAKRATVSGFRAKKDGTPGVVYCEFDITIGQVGVIRGHMPLWMVDVASEAVETVRGWVA